MREIAVVAMALVLTACPEPTAPVEECELWGVEVVWSTQNVDGTGAGVQVDTIPMWGGCDGDGCICIR